MEYQFFNSFSNKDSRKGRGWKKLTDNKDRTRRGERVGDGRKDGKEQTAGGGREEEDVTENWAMK